MARRVALWLVCLTHAQDPRIVADADCMTHVSKPGGADMRKRRSVGSALITLSVACSIEGPAPAAENSAGEDESGGGGASESTESDGQDDQAPIEPAPESRMPCGDNLVAQVTVPADYGEGTYEWTFCVWEGEDFLSSSSVVASQSMPLPLPNASCLLDDFLKAAPGDALVPRVLIDACPDPHQYVRDDADIFQEGLSVSDLKIPGAKHEYPVQARQDFCRLGGSATWESQECEQSEDYPSVAEACPDHVVEDKDRCGTGWSTLDTYSCSSNNISDPSSAVRFAIAACGADIDPLWRLRSSCSGSYGSWHNFGLVEEGDHGEFTLSAGWKTCDGGSSFLTHYPDYTCHNTKDFNIFATCTGTFHWTASFVRLSGDFDDHLGC